MNRRGIFACAVLLAALGGAGFAGYRLSHGAVAAPPAAAAPKADRPVLYYRAPMGAAEYSPVPKKDAMGMDYVPVYDDDDPPAAAATAPAPGKILFYRNPMGLPDTSPVPKRDPMGMDYVPVYAGDEAAPSGTAATGTVKISAEKRQLLGVRTEAAALRSLLRTIRANGTIQPDERGLSVFSTRFEGWIETLHVNATGQAVHRGDALMEIYAPDLLAAQQEYLLAGRTLRSVAEAGPEARAGAQGLVEAARQRLRNFGFTDEQFALLARQGALRRLTLRAPADGVVLEKSAVQGMRFMPGDALYRFGDLATVWLVAEVYEQDLAAIRTGMSVAATLVAYPGVRFDGVVTFIYPTMSRETRTTKLRIEMPNPDGRLKLDMFATVELAAPLTPGPVLAVPESAVLDTGARQAVLVDRGDGRFEPRAVAPGLRADGYVEIRDGLRAGEAVVVGANFLIDAESNMKAALRAFTAPDATTTSAAQPAGERK